MNTVLIWLIRYYQKCLSKNFRGCCRFRPSCSYYALESIKKFGWINGLRLCIKRLLRCRPSYLSGYDPVPASTAEIDSALKGKLVVSNRDTE